MVIRAFFDAFQTSRQPLVQNTPICGVYDASTRHDSLVPITTVPLYQGISIPTLKNTVGPNLSRGIAL
jgi:hypothetical protein